MSESKASYAPPSHPPHHDGELRPLPEGWIKQFDSNSNAFFYVDTKASPPRSIWVHPFDDPEYIRAHPEHRNHDPLLTPPSSPPPDYEEAASSRKADSSTTRPNANVSDKGKGKEPHRSLLGKLKDKAIGTKEEREEARRQKEMFRQQMLREREERLARQRAHAAQYGAPPTFQGFGQPGYGQAYGQPGYGQAYGQPSYGGFAQQPMYASQSRRTGFGGGGMGMPLLGGLAGGLLLGDLLGGGFGGDGGDGGGFGGDGGDGGGGDFGGGDF